MQCSCFQTVHGFLEHIKCVLTPLSVLQRPCLTWHLAPAQLSCILYLTICLTHYALLHSPSSCYLYMLNLFPPLVLCLDRSLCLVGRVPHKACSFLPRRPQSTSLSRNLWPPTQKLPSGASIGYHSDYFNPFALTAICSFLVYYFIVCLLCIEGEYHENLFKHMSSKTRTVWHLLRVQSKTVENNEWTNSCPSLWQIYDGESRQRMACYVGFCVLLCLFQRPK